jgi:hypothetical protein
MRMWWEDNIKKNISYIQGRMKGWAIRAATRGANV